MSQSLLRLGLLGAFAICGLWSLWDFNGKSFPSPSGPDSSLDDLARRHLLLDRGAANIRDQLAHLPSDQPILLIGPGDDWSLSEVYFLVSYLAWPRPVWSVGLMNSEMKSHFDNPPPKNTRPSAVLFYAVNPRLGQQVEQIGTRLGISRIQTNHP